MNEEVRMKSPDTKILSRISQKIKAQLEQRAEILELEEVDAVDVYEALDWVCDFLAKRRDYHKGRSVKQRVERQVLEEALRAHGVDIAEVKRRAHSAVSDALIDESTEEPVFPPARRS